MPKVKVGEIGSNGVMAFELGYKGPGMCANCAYRGPKVPYSNKYLCTYYASSCKQVSRNCVGIKSIITSTKI